VAYQTADVVAKAIALILLPIYTRHLSRADYGTAELLLVLVILISIAVRFGIIEAFLRFYYHHDSDEHRTHIARTATSFLLAVTTVCAALVALFAAPISKLLLGFEDTVLIYIVALGIWAFTNLELAYALLRVDGKAKTYLIASLCNVALTVIGTVTLVVFLDEGAKGLMAGNYIASLLTLLGVWYLMRSKLALKPGKQKLQEMIKFGGPTVPAELSIFALNFVDRLYLFRFESEGAAGLYSLAVKLTAAVVIVVRGFQYAWPPLAYSVKSDEEASALYSRVATYYCFLLGYVVVGIALFGPWVLRIFAAPEFFAAHKALVWIAIGWALFGLFLVLTTIAGRAGVTTRNAPAALTGLIVNVALLPVLVPVYGIAGAGMSLCAAYIVVLIVMYLLTRKLFVVHFEWLRIVHLIVVFTAVTVLSLELLPADGLLGLTARTGVFIAVAGLLFITRFFPQSEVEGVRKAFVTAKAMRYVRKAAKQNF